MADSRTIPPTDFDDDDPAGQAAWEIATAETLRARGDLADAASWYRRAANHLMEAGDDERAIEIAKLAAELVALESAVRPASEREPRPASTAGPTSAGASTMPTSAPRAIASSAPSTIASVPAPARPVEPPRAKPIEPAPGSAAARLFGSKPTGSVASPAAVATAANPTANPTANPATSAAPPQPKALSQSASATSSASPSIAAPPQPKASVVAPASVPRPASAVPPPAGARVPAGSFIVPKPAPAARTAESKAPASAQAPQPSLRPSAYAAPATPAARTAEIPAMARAPSPAQIPAHNPFAAEDDSTSVIALGAIASPIASLLDEAVANLDPPEASTATAVSKRPLSFLPQRAAESESIAARLSALPLFSELPPDQLRQLSRQLITESRSADENVCESGAPEGPLYVVLSGSAWVGVAGRSSPLAVVTAGDIIGEIAALYGGPRTATVVAREPMELVGVAPSALRSMARDFPSFRESLIESVRDRMRESLPHIATSLRRLSDEARKAFLEACEFVELTEGQEMLLEGEPAPALFLIAAGEAECYGGELGVSRAVRARVGEIVGAGSALTAAPSGVSARAARTLLAARVSREKVRELLKRVPSLTDLLDDVAAPGRGVVC